MEIGSWPNLVAMFADQAVKRGEQPFLWEKIDGRYQPLSWSEVARQVGALAAALQSHGLGRGERVLLLSQNSPRWVIADLAIMAAGGVTVPTYITNTARDHAHVLSDSGAAMAVISTAALARPFFEAAHRSRALKRAIVMEDLGDLDTGRVARTAWQEAIASGAVGAEAVMAAVPQIDGDGLACLIYTSGTGGEPKGVMLSHRAIIANCVGAADVLAELGLDNEVFLSFLPLSPRLRAHRRPDVPDLARRPDLLRRTHRHGGDQSHRGATDDHDRGAPALRDLARAHPAHRGAAGPPARHAVLDGRRARPQALRAAARP